MAESRHTTRRTFLKAAPLAAAAISSPVSATSSVETQRGKCERLLRELFCEMGKLPIRTAADGSAICGFEIDPHHRVRYVPGDDYDMLLAAIPCSRMGV